MKNIFKVIKFAGYYDEDNWICFSKCFNHLELPKELQGILPEDIMKSLYGVVGIQSGDWAYYELHQLGHYKAVELVRTKIGLKALKALILRIPN